MASRHYPQESDSLKIYLDEVNCSGNESNILDCQHHPIGSHNCGHDEDVSVDCSGGETRVSTALLYRLAHDP